ncbi:rhodanese-like domain-containing protein [Variovorax sp. N23]|uniref:rhodanese-like domain-containing protein n=1 Tax=Variovorax sp. N23 TaxID=2980555 RepID=UPI0021C6EA39|nr:rhodanese-like domain-containing protein [Variovorax sp. N23]MCU4119945.1 rhodanese-like domain-containing protein [Variovorax sp. N23]
MSLTDFPVETAGNDIANARARAIDAFLERARGLLTQTQDVQSLQAVADALIALGQQGALFPAAHFSVDAARPAQVYRLAEDADGSFALYLSAGLAGKAQPPHDHTTWAVIAGVEGNERNVLYRREKTTDATRDTLVQTRTVDVAAGSAVVLLPDDVHTIELIGGQDGRHLHFYGLALDRLDRRVVFESNEGGSFRHFAPPKNIRHPAITPQALKAALSDGEEIALLDVRETGVFVRSHILLAASAPLWRLELLIDRLVPRRGTRIVLTDANESLAHDAAAKLVRLGWRNVSVLAGGTGGWAAAGYELFSGSNVPSKAFGEVIEHEKHTPWISVDDLHERVERGDDIVVVDSRTPEEFADFSLPFAHSLPGAELVYRIQELAPRPETLVVVNCAGRTRSIVGAQTLIDAGIPNQVVSLKDGTMAWLLAGRELAHGRTAPLPEPGEQTRRRAAARAEDVAARAGVRRIDAATLARFEAESDERSLYRFDVRTRQEYEAGHLEGWRWAPGGQLVQATDEYVGTRRARIVLADWDGVRALTTGAWLAQLGGHEVFVLSPPALPVLVLGPEPVRVLSLRAFTPDIAPREAAAALEAGTAVVFDVERRSAFERRHVAGARFAVPDRLQEFTADLPVSQVIVLTSSDGVLARTAAAELAARTGRTVRALAGGTQAWIAARLPTATGPEGVLTGDDDHWYSPYAHANVAQRDAGFQQYLDWEIGLVAQLAREGDVGIRLVAPSETAAS